MEQILGPKKHVKACIETQGRHGKNVNPKKTQIRGGRVHLKPELKKV